MKETHSLEDRAKQSDFYRTIAESSFAGIYVVQEGRFSYLNPNAASYAGYAPQELTGCISSTIVHPEDRERVMKMARAMLKGIRSEPYEFRIITKTGQVRWIMETVTAIRYKDQPAILGNSMDVTEKMEMEKALLESEERFRNIIEHSSVLFYTQTPDHVLTFVSENAEYFFGCSSKEAMISWKEFLTDHPVNRIGIEATRRAIDTGERQPPYELELRKKNGDIIWVEVHESPVREDGKTVAVIGTLMDISLRKWAEDALKDSENRFRILIETTRDLIFSVDRKGLFTYINKSFEDALGYAPDDLIGKPFTFITAPESIPVVSDSFQRGMEGETVSPYEVHLIDKNGNLLAVEFLTSILLNGRTGQSVGLFGIGRDIMERKRTEDLRREADKRLADMIDFLPDATLAIDREGRVIAWNRAIEDMTGISKEEMIGKGDYEYALPFYGLRRPILVDLVLHPDGDADDGYSFLHRTGNNLIAEPAAPTIIAGKKLYLWAKASPLFDTQGDIVGAIESIRDVTNIKRAEQDLIESELKYRKIFDNAVVGMFQSTSEGRFVRVNPALAKMCGFTSPAEMVELITDIAIQHYVYPEDREYFKETMKRQGFIEDFEHATHRKDGSVFWVSVSAREVRDDLGHFLYYEGNHVDITDRKLAQDALKSSEERYRTIIENIGDGYYEVDLKGNILFVNDAFAQITGVPHHKLIGEHFREFALKEDERELYSIFHRVFMTGKPEKGLVSRINRPDGKEQYVEISVSLKKDSKGKPTGFMGILHDVTERRKAEETIQWMAYHDALTGLPNRILFHDRLAVALTQAKRNREQLAVMILDLDKFKEINDSYGHYMGDCILCAFVENVKRQLREGDTVARMGGDEFMILLPGIRQVEDLEKLGQKIIEAFRAPVEVGERSFVIRTSLGIALYPRDGQDFDTLVKKADMAMYQAKNLGGNKYVICC